MKEKNEKIKDIVAEYRYDLQDIADGKRGALSIDETRILLDRIEAANKREIARAKKLLQQPDCGARRKAETAKATDATLLQEGKR